MRGIVDRFLTPTNDQPQGFTGLLTRYLSEPRSRGRKANSVDKAQAAADVAGVADQTGTVDLANAGVSLLRGFASKNKQERRGHFKDAGIRALSAVPIIGDVAKLGRAGKYRDIARSMFEGGRAAKAAPQGSRLRSFFGETSRAASQRASGMGGRSDPANTSGLAQTLLGGNRGDRGDDPRMEREREANRRADNPQVSGLSASQKIGMMGAGRAAIDAADADARINQERKRAEDELLQRQEEMADTLAKMKKGALGVVTALVGLPKVTERFSGALVESRRHLAGFNGTMAAANAQMDISRIRMDMQTAQNTGGSSAHVTDELRKLRESMQPLREIKETVTNATASIALWIAQAITQAGTDVLDTIGLIDLIKHLEQWLGMEANQNPQMMPLHHAVQGMINNFPMNNKGRRDPLPPLRH